jgi:NitT/TauT family transport system substrate-binding protein
MKKLGIAFTALMLFAGSANAEKVKLGLQPWLGYGPLWVAKEKGFFEKHKVDVDLTTFNWDQDMTAALASGNLNVVAGATNGLITNFNQGVDQKGFLVMDLSFEADAVIAGSDIKSIADLKGKKIAFEAGSTSDLLINYALKSNGMSTKDVEVVPMGASEAGLAIIAGRVDAAVSYEPYISAALSQDKTKKILFTAAEKPGLISDMLTAKSEWIKSNPDDVKGLIMAWDDAINFIRENPEEGGAIIAKAVGSPKEEFEPAFKGVRFYNIDENIKFLGGDFQATIKTVGEILQVAAPDRIKKIPAPEDILALDAIMGMKK